MQFPLTVAQVIMIHKSHGLTLAKMIMDIGVREFTYGLIYVPLFRVRKLRDIIIMPFYPLKRFVTFTTYKQFRERLHLLETISVKSIMSSVDIVIIRLRYCLMLLRSSLLL